MAVPFRNTLGYPNPVTAVVVGDCNGDGFPDVGTAHGPLGFLYWLTQEGNPTPTFGFHPVGTIGVPADAGVAADFNGDGYDDWLAVGGPGSSTANVVLADGTPSCGLGPAFTPAIGTALSGAVGVGMLHAPDVDQDGDVDILVASGESGTVAWLENVGGGGSVWTPHVLTSSMGGLTSLVWYDVDHDGAGDLVGSVLGSEIFWVRSAGATGPAGPFGPTAFSTNKTTVDAGPHVGGKIAVADMRALGVADIVSVNASDGSLAVYHGEPGGVFGPRTVIEWDILPRDKPFLELARFGDANDTALLSIATTSSSGTNGVQFFVPMVQDPGRYLLRVAPRRAVVTDGPVLHFVSWDMTQTGRGDFAHYVDTLDQRVLFGVGGRTLFQSLINRGTLGTYPVRVRKIVAGFITPRARVALVIMTESSVAIDWYGMGQMTTPLTRSTVLGYDDIKDVAVADVNMDGMADLVTVGGATGSLRGALNGDGEFGSIILQLPVLIAGARAIDLGDLDGDGWVDALVGTDSSVVWLENTRDSRTPFAPTMDPSVILDGLFEPVDEVRVADLNGDELADVVVSTGGSLLVLLGNATAAGGFVAGATLAPVAGTGITRFKVADIDMDGAADVVGLCWTGLLFWVPSPGTAAGGAPVVHTIHNSSTVASTHFDVADVNDDGTVDVVMATTATQWSVFLNPVDSPGTLGSATQLVTADLGISTDGPVVMAATQGTRWPYLFTGDVLNRVWYAGINVDTPLSVPLPREVTADTPGGITSVFDSRSPCFKFGPGGGRTVGCVQALMSHTSACVTDTVVLDAETYTTCRTDSHLEPEWRVSVRGAASGDTVIDCGTEGGVMIAARPARVLTSGLILESSPMGVFLEDLTIRRMTSGVSSLRAASGLRAEDDGSFLHLERVTIDSSKPLWAKQEGGGAALARAGALLVLRNSTVHDCTTRTSGGAVAGLGLGTRVCVLEHTRFENNLAASAGGALDVSIGALAVVVGPGVVFSTNTATWGGAISASKDSNVTVGPGVVLESNWAYDVGGGLVASEGAHIKTVGPDVVLQFNRATVAGGVGARTGSHIEIGPGTHITGNSAYWFGGGAGVILPALCRITGADLENNLARLGGGILVVDGSRLDLLLSTFSHTLSLPRVDVSGGVPDAVVVRDSRITSNLASKYGQAVAACGAGRVVLGPGTVVRSSNAFVCMPDTLAPGATMDPENLALLDIASDTVDMALVAPLVSVAWQTKPSTIMPGPTVDAVMRPVNGFGDIYVDVHLSFTVSLTGAPELELTGLTRFQMSSTVLPNIYVQAKNASVVPTTGAVLTVAPLLHDSTAPTDPNVVLTAELDIQVCQPGWGGSQGLLFGCLACDGDTYSIDSSTEPCKVCPDNSVRASSNTTEPCLCNPGYVTTRVDDTELTCAKCATGAVCPGGTDPAVAAPGYFPVGDGTFVRCLRPEACVGGSLVCRRGYTGYLCGDCWDGWYSNANADCVECSGVSGAVLGISVVGMVVLCGVCGVALAYMFTRGSGANAEDGGQAALRRPGLPGSIGMVIAALQVLSILGEARVAWPSTAKNALFVFQAFVLDINVFASECSLASFHVKYVMSVVVVPVMLGVVFATLVGGRAAGRMGVGPTFLGGLGTVPTRTLFDLVLFTGCPLLYIPMSRNAFVLFDCTRLPNGDVVLDKDPAVECLDGAWWSVAWIGAAAVVVFVVGVPAYFFWCLHRRRGKLLLGKTIRRFGALYRLYRLPYYWGGVSDLGRRLCVVVVSVFFSNQVLMQMGMFLALFMGALVAAVRLQPFYFPLYNELDARLSACVLAVLVLGMASYGERHVSSSDTALVVLVILVLVLLGAVAVHGIARDVLMLARMRKGMYSPAQDRLDRIAATAAMEAPDFQGELGPLVLDSFDRLSVVDTAAQVELDALVDASA